MIKGVYEPKYAVADSEGTPCRLPVQPDQAETCMQKLDSIANLPEVQQSLPPNTPILSVYNLATNNHSV